MKLARSHSSRARALTNRHPEAVRRTSSTSSISGTTGRPITGRRATTSPPDSRRGAGWFTSSARGCGPRSGRSGTPGRLVRKLAACFRGPRDSGAGFPVVTLFQLPFHRYRAVRALNRLLARRAVRGLMRRYGFRNPVVHMTVPHLSHLIGRVGERMAVYYCVDDYSAIPGVNVEAVRAMDERGHPQVRPRVRRLGDTAAGEAGRQPEHPAQPARGGRRPLRRRSAARPGPRRRRRT